MSATKIPPGSDGLIVLPYLLGRYLAVDPNARGTMFGLTPSHTKEHVYRALLESIGYEIAEWLESLAKAGVKAKRLVATGGGARSRVWMQIVSNIINKPQQLSRGDAPYGNAFLAGYSIGLFHTFDPIANEWLSKEEIINPSPESNAIYVKYRRIYKQLYANLRDVFREL